MKPVHYPSILSPAVVAAALLLGGTVAHAQTLAAKSPRAINVTRSANGATPNGATPNVAAPNVVNIVASDYAFDMPATIPAGVTTLRLSNKGKELHHVYLVKVDNGKSSKDVMAWMKAGGPPPRWMRPVGGPNASAGVTELTSTLTAGSYVAFCVIPSPDGAPHIMKGMIKDVQVTPSNSSAAAPVADVTLTLKDYDFTFSKPLTPGKHVIAVTNAGPQPHEFFFAKLMPGKTPMDMAKFAEKPAGAPPGMPMGGITDIMPGDTVYLTVTVPAGEYAFICFDPDAKDGKPHLTHGMIKQISVK